MELSEKYTEIPSEVSPPRLDDPSTTRAVSAVQLAGCVWGVHGGIMGQEGGNCTLNVKQNKVHILTEGEIPRIPRSFRGLRSPVEPPGI